VQTWDKNKCGVNYEARYVREYNESDSIVDFYLNLAGQTTSTKIHIDSVVSMSIDKIDNPQ